jgi:hypothetical protein
VVLTACALFFCVHVAELPRTGGAQAAGVGDPLMCVTKTPGGRRHPALSVGRQRTRHDRSRVRGSPLGLPTPHPDFHGGGFSAPHDPPR